MEPGGLRVDGWCLKWRFEHQVNVLLLHVWIDVCFSFVCVWAMELAFQRINVRLI